MIHGNLLISDDKLWIIGLSLLFDPVSSLSGQTRFMFYYPSNIYRMHCHFIFCFITTFCPPLPNSHIYSRTSSNMMQAPVMVLSAYDVSPFLSFLFPNLLLLLVLFQTPTQSVRRDAPRNWATSKQLKPYLTLCAQRWAPARCSRCC